MNWHCSMSYVAMFKHQNEMITNQKYLYIHASMFNHIKSVDTIMITKLDHFNNNKKKKTRLKHSFQLFFNGGENNSMLNSLECHGLAECSSAFRCIICILAVSCFPPHDSNLEFLNNNNIPADQFPIHNQTSRLLFVELLTNC